MAIIPLQIVSIEPNPIGEEGGLLNMSFPNNPLKKYGLDVSDPALFSSDVTGVITDVIGDTYSALVIKFEPPYTEITIQIPSIRVILSPGENEMICSVALVLRLEKQPHIGVSINGRDMLRVKKGGVTPGGGFSISNIIPRALNRESVMDNGAKLRLVGSDLDTATKAVFTNNIDTFNVIMAAKEPTSMIISIPPHVNSFQVPPFKWKVGLTNHNGKLEYSPWVSLID